MIAPYLVRGAIIAFAWLAVVNAGATMAVVIAAPRVSRGRSAERSAAVWLSLRLLPSAASLLFVAVLFIPSYFRYEPLELGEGVDVTLASLALVSAVIVGTSVARGIASWRRASRRTRAWIGSARPIALAGAPMDAYELPIAAPFMALTGVFRPRLVLTRGVVDALTPEELHASVAHEVGHWRARDNLKRLAMRAAPDFLFATRAASAIESRWAAAAEHAADRRAGADPHTRCALASALVKVAKLTPAPTPLADPISTLVDGGEVASRVRRLLDDAERPRSQRRWRVPLAALAIAAPLAAAYAPLLRIVHEATELLVNALP